MPRSVPAFLLREMLHCGYQVGSPRSENSRSQYARAKKPRSSALGSRSMKKAPRRVLSSKITGLRLARGPYLQRLARLAKVAHYGKDQVSFLRHAARAYRRRSGHVAALRDFSDRRAARQNGALLPAARPGLPKVLFGADQRIRAAR